MSKIRKIIYRNKMKLMENRHSTKGVYCHGAKKNKIVYETNAKALRAVMLCEDQTIRTYYCHYCAGFHTTSRPEHDELDDLYMFARAYVCYSLTLIMNINKENTSFQCEVLKFIQ